MAADMTRAGLAAQAKLLFRQYGNSSYNYGTADERDSWKQQEKCAAQCEDFKTRFNAAIDQLAAHQAEVWISVEDRLPEPNTDCVAWVKALSQRQGGPTHYAYVTRWAEQHEAPVSFSSATIPIGLGWDGFDYDDVTHWQPLPKPPAIPTDSPGAAGGGVGEAIDLGINGSRCGTHGTSGS
jgi:hypothetical protein